MPMLGWSVVCLIVACACALFGFGGIVEGPIVPVIRATFVISLIGMVATILAADYRTPRW